MTYICTAMKFGWLPALILTVLLGALWYLVLKQQGDKESRPKKAKAEWTPTGKFAWKPADAPCPWAFHEEVDMGSGDTRWRKTTTHLTMPDGAKRKFNDSGGCWEYIMRVKDDEDAQ